MRNAVDAAREIRNVVSRLDRLSQRAFFAASLMVEMAAAPGRDRFHDHVLRIDETGVVEVHIAPVGNAICAAAGKRTRKLRLRRSTFSLKPCAAGLPDLRALRKRSFADY